jgi:cyclopropane-fatty-acyl-phospholipid synthase
LGAISQAVATTRDLRLVHLEDFSEHYADTLAAWRSRFWTNVEAIRQLGLDERFVRMWDYYLAYCEAGFRERMTGVSQLHWVRGAGA